MLETGHVTTASEQQNTFNSKPAHAAGFCFTSLATPGIAQRLPSEPIPQAWLILFVPRSTQDGALS